MMGKKTEAKVILTPQKIRSYVGAQSYERGEDYAQSGYIYDGRVSGDIIKARSRGSSGGPYRVSATVTDGQIILSDCSCPIGGACKHVAAMLLIWLDAPEEFTEVKDGRKSLANRSKEELLALVEHMLDREPDLEDVLDMPLPTKQKKADKGSATKTPASNTAIKLDPKPYHRQAVKAFSGAYEGDYNWSYDVAHELEAIVNIGHGFLKQKSPVQAASVFQGVAEGVIDHSEETQNDQDGEILSIGSECADGIDKCLNFITEASIRQSLLGTLLDLKLTDIEMGGVDFDGSAQDHLLTHASLDEKKVLAARLRKEIGSAKGGGYSSDWRRTLISGLLLELEAASLTDEEYLKICRENGHTVDLIERLLKLKRLDEALAEAKQMDDRTLISAANVFIQHKKMDTLEPILVQKEAHPRKTNEFSNLTQWLRDFYQGRQDWDKALDYTLKLFTARASLAHYQEIETLARKLKRWDELHPQLIAQLIARKEPTTLITVYLHNKNFDAAVEVASGLSYSYFNSYSDIRTTVALAVEASHPRFALGIYRGQCEEIIKRRDRRSYDLACRNLLKVKQLYASIGETHVWDAYFVNIRENTRQMPAFRDELRKVKLV